MPISSQFISNIKPYLAEVVFDTAKAHRARILKEAPSTRADMRLRTSPLAIADRTSWNSDLSKMSSSAEVADEWFKTAESMVKKIGVKMADCPDCIHCEHAKFELHSKEDFLSNAACSRVFLMLTANCSSDFCPSFVENANLAPNFPVDFRSPYTKTSDDTPSTPSSFSW